jgi:hypothetical protein
MTRVFQRESEALLSINPEEVRALGCSIFANREEGTGGIEVLPTGAGWEIRELTAEELYLRECGMLRVEEDRLRSNAVRWLERAARWKSEATKAEYQRVAGLEMAKADLVAKQIQSLMAARTKQIVAAHRAVQQNSEVA